MEMRVKAHAKINWALNILGFRPNGYHELDMLMQSVELCDEMVFRPAEDLTLSVNGGPRECDDKNLVIRAAKALCAHVGKELGAQIDLAKYIPARAGMGGGSADCAAALIALNDMWKLELPMETLLSIGLKLGADVPFCLTGGLARVSGIGENIDPMPAAPAIPLAMVTPGGGLSTQDVFRAWDAGDRAVSTHDMYDLARAVMDKDLGRIAALTHNSLEVPAINMMPEIGACMAAFRDLGAGAVFMTGSGSTVVAAFETDEQARNAAARVPGAVFTRTCA
ncbi:MAG: 4-(cytidine 5'-diphospho)-2-C-methyl-D-erythritol kinase [Clostridiales bacterium]|nr:4-(cytidine 5'-diphospho)-2-C-methyl-D-erythritol kinase [Clostridiales bacterium]